MKLGKDVFVALAAVAWADGVVKDEEVVALLGAARACGLSGSELEDVRAALETKTDIERVTAVELGEEERSFVYGIAAWLTRVDGFVAPDETATLARLGDLLGLSHEDRALAARAAASTSRASGSALPSGLLALGRAIEDAAQD